MAVKAAEGFSKKMGVSEESLRVAEARLKSPDEKSKGDSKKKK